MKVITWNVNSIRTRLPRVLALLARHQPDVLCLQETKVPDDDFPLESIEGAGYHAAIHGQKGGYNGVAILSREPATDIRAGFDGNPVPEQARVISARVEGVAIVNAYVINGQSLESDKYPLKLDWLAALQRFLASRYQPTDDLLMVGDFNIAPDDRDVHNPESWKGQVLCTDAERRLLQSLLAWGLVDLFRVHREEGGLYSWWDYRFGAFRQNLGLRIDLILGSASMRARSVGVEIDREERKAKSGEGKPSDHAPVIATFEQGPA